MNLLISLIVVLLIASFAAVLVNCKSYKYYSKVYKHLPYLKLYRYGSSIYSYRVEDAYKSKISEFHKLNGTYRLGDGHYLHDFIITYLDPYSLYWFLKYNRWFKENIDIDKLEKW